MIIFTVVVLEEEEVAEVEEEAEAAEVEPDATENS